MSWSITTTGVPCSRAMGWSFLEVIQSADGGGVAFANEQADFPLREWNVNAPSAELFEYGLINFGACGSKINDGNPRPDGDADRKIAQGDNANHRRRVFEHARIALQDFAQGRQRILEIGC